MHLSLGQLISASRMTPMHSFIGNSRTTSS
jgi:hypothetical protein